MIFLRRREPREDPFLGGKVKLFFVGGALGLVGMARESSLLVGIALLVLLGGVAAGVVASRRGKREPQGPEGEDPADRTSSGGP